MRSGWRNGVASVSARVMEGAGTRTSAAPARPTPGPPRAPMPACRPSRLAARSAGGGIECSKREPDVVLGEAACGRLRSNEVAQLGELHLLVEGIVAQSVEH